MKETRNSLNLKQPKIVDLYKTGQYTLSDICGLLHTSEKFIFKTLRLYNIPYKNSYTEWSLDDINWLKNNYATLGPEKCGLHLNKKSDATSYKGRMLGLKYEYPDEHIDMTLFDDIKLPEVSYLLGLFYADGSVRNSGGNVISLTSKTTDALQIYDVIMKTGDWKFYTYNRTPNEISYFKVASKKLMAFLCDHDYYEKSTRSADKILSKIPENLHQYFFRGFLDGDGFIRSRPAEGCELGFAGHIEQDWTFMCNLLKRLNVNFRIDKREFKTRTGKLYHGSVLSVYNSINCIGLLNYLYNNRENDNIGLTRKYEKYLTIKNNITDKLKHTHNISRIQNKDSIVYKTTVTHNKIKFIKTSHTELDAIKFKYDTIKTNNSEEYKLRTLLNCWNFTLRFDSLRSEVHRDELFPHSSD